MNEPLEGVIRALSATIAEQQKVIQEQYALIQKLSVGKTEQTEESMRRAAQLALSKKQAQEVDTMVGLAGRGGK